MIISENPLQTQVAFELSMDLPEMIFGQDALEFEAKSVWCKPDINPALYNTGFQLLNLNEEKALVLARISEGSLGRAIRMCEGYFFKQREDYLSSIIQLPGMSSEQALEMAIEYARMEKKGTSREPGKGDSGLIDLLSIWKSWYRDLLLVKVDCPADLLINVDFSHKLKTISRSSRIEGLMESLHVVDQSQRDLVRNRNVDLMMEHTVLALKRLTGQKATH